MGGATLGIDMVSGTNNLRSASLDKMDARSVGVLLTAAEVAERLRVPVSWIRKHGNKLPGFVRLRKYVRWCAEELDQFVAAGGLT